MNVLSPLEADQSTNRLVPLPHISAVLLSCDCSLIVEVGCWPTYLEVPLAGAGAAAVSYAIDGDTLSIHWPDTNVECKDAIVHVRLPSIELVENHDAGTVTVTGTLSGVQLTLRNEGTGSIQVQATGDVDTLDVEQDGAGPIACRNVVARRGLVTALRTSSGDVDVHVTGDLQADAWGAGTVRVHGAPTTRKCSTGDGANGGAIVFENAA